MHQRGSNWKDLLEILCWGLSWKSVEKILIFFKVIPKYPALYTKTYLRFIVASSVNILKPTGHVMHQQFNIQQLYALPTLYLSENKQRLVPLTA